MLIDRHDRDLLQGRLAVLERSNWRPYLEDDLDRMWYGDRRIDRHAELRDAHLKTERRSK